jgi:hypothetical protein
VEVRVVLRDPPCHVGFEGGQLVGDVQHPVPHLAVEQELVEVGQADVGDDQK